MKALLLFGALLFHFVSVFAQDEADLVKKVKDKLEKVKDYTAQGKMKIDVSFIDAPESRVKIYYKNPDKFKVKKDGGISILPKGGISINPATLLAGSDFEVIPAKDASIDGVTMKVVKLIPSDEESDVVLTTLYIDDKNLVVRKASVTTKENGTYEILLTYGKYIEWGLPDKVVFSFNTKDFKLPKGITFEYEDGDRKKKDLSNKKGSVQIRYSSYVINEGVDDGVFD